MFILLLLIEISIKLNILNDKLLIFLYSLCRNLKSAIEQYRKVLSAVETSSTQSLRQVIFFIVIILMFYKYS